MNYAEKGDKAYLISIVMVAVIGGLLFGYDTAVISGAEKGLQAFFMGAKDFVYSDAIHGITSSSALIGCIIGSAISGLLASNLGRKKTLFIAGICYLLSALGSYYPEFLFFDEATNALDANNEKEIMEHLHEFYKGKTVVVVAHRLSTVKDADKIVVLDKGCIVEEGTHRELTERKGLYYRLVKNQLELGS